MNKFLLLLAVVFASALAFMNCGPAGKCGPATCGGCCDSSGTCITATTATACGKLGETCNTCMAPTNVCIAGACAQGTVGGGGGGGTTGGGTGGGTTGGGTGGGTTGGGSGCTAMDFSAAESLFGRYSNVDGGTPNHQGVVGQPSAVSGKFDFIAFESWYFGPNSNPTFPQTVPVPSPDATNYTDCADCILLDEACDNTGSNCAHSYYATGGNMVITTATRNTRSGVFTATATNLNFAEWNFSANPDLAVPNGRCVTVATVTIDAGWSVAVPDAGVDAGIDAGIDAGVEVDAGIDAGLDDAGFDAGP